MADKDIKLIQEQATGAPKESVVTPTANSGLGFDGSKDPVAIPAATQPEAEAGTETALRSWSPLRVGESIAALAPSPANASDTVAGIIEIATASEADLAVATNKAMVPSVMRIRRDANGAVSIGDLGGDARGANSITIQASRGSVGQVASGTGATAIGISATASRGYATAIGTNATASGYYTTASGYYTTASGYFANASGFFATASGFKATASGYRATASGYSANGVGTTATASGTSAIAIGTNANASGNYSTAIGFTATASGTNATASGYYTTASQTNGGAFGYRAKSAVANVQELGYWSNYTTRGGAVRVHGTGMVALTMQDRATAYTDGGETKGSEADNTVLREGFAIRRNGDVILIDINVGGTVKTLSLGTAS